MGTLHLGVVAAALALAGAASAQDLGCFGRDYDAAHLKAHPRQRMTGLRLKLSPLDNPTFVRTAQLTVRLKGRGPAYYVGGDCTAAGQGFDCGMDEDAGAFTLTPQARGWRLTLTGDLRLNRAGQDSEESEGPYVKTSDPEDRVFLLYPQACR